MKTWQLNSVSGSTPDVRDYCRQLFLSYTRNTDPEYFNIGPRGGRSRNTYRRFHNAITELSKRYPDDVLTLRYTFKDREDERGEIHIIEYKNGKSEVVSIETNE
ncbi:MAG: hypothetical protein CVU71_00345 [Deltaproteobacteria bacterium HGW-Deltaproteobacteria-6]|jgi:hypothetical protein|nr:MAG: hypothetical protein CVU71_00345 [Deltaproteobacteria bacterium HGW-Deltaproteobacteria-6]